MAHSRRMRPHPLLQHTHTIACADQDFAQWRQGRLRYLLWALEVERPAVARRLAAARLHLAPWLLAGYRRQAHITLAVRGFAAQPCSPHGMVCPLEAPDTCRATALARDVAALRAAAVAPWTLSLGGLSSFAMAPFLAVSAGEVPVLQLHQALADAAAASGPADGASPAEHRMDYRPHATVGLYAHRVACTEVLQRLQAWNGAAHPGAHSDRGEVSVPVRAVALLSYDARDIGGPLACEGRLDLRSLRWQPGAGACAALVQQATAGLAAG